MMDEQLGNHSMFVGRKYHTAGLEEDFASGILLTAAYNPTHVLM